MSSRKTLFTPLVVIAFVLSIHNNGMLVVISNIVYIQIGVCQLPALIGISIYIIKKSVNLKSKWIL